MQETENLIDPITKRIPWNKSSRQEKRVSFCSMVDEKGET
jgi:hypothetical protein